VEIVRVAHYVTTWTNAVAKIDFYHHLICVCVARTSRERMVAFDQVVPHGRQRAGCLD